jgi:predicted DNA-binding transcriptional regulator AlpA
MQKSLGNSEDFCPRYFLPIFCMRCPLNLAGMSNAATPIDSERLAVTARDAATLLGISRAQLYRLHSSGRLGPQPIYLGAKAPRWSVAELRDWLAGGCPNRQVWQRLREGAR